MPAAGAEKKASISKVLVLQTEDGKLYQITGGLAADNNAKLVAHVSHKVEITGETSEKDGKMTIAADSLKMISR